MTPGKIDESYTYRVLNGLIGTDNIVQVRDDFKWLAYNHIPKFKKWNPTEQHLRKEALEAGEKAKSSTWDKYSIVLGVLGVLTALTPLPFSGFISLIGLVITIITMLRRVAVELLIFNNPYQIYHKKLLKFSCAWNRAMNGWTSLLVMPIGILNALSPDRYKLGLWVLEEKMKDKYESGKI